MPDATGEPFFHVDFGTGQTVDLEALRRRRSALMPDNGHAWVISTVYALDDPEQALDTMELTAENFVGVFGISCLLCEEKYRTMNRFHKCPQAPHLARFTCPRCGRSSSHPQDKANGYCGACHDFTAGT